MKTCTYVCCANVVHLRSYLKMSCYHKSTPFYLRPAVARLKTEGGDVDTRSPSPRLYRLSTHKFKVTRGTSLRSVKTRVTDLTSVSSTPQPHKREPARGSAPQVYDLFQFLCALSSVFICFPPEVISAPELFEPVL